MSRKSGELTARNLQEVINTVEQQWKIPVVAMCSDAGPDASKARRLLLQARPDIVSFDCYSHQVRFNPPLNSIY